MYLYMAIYLTSKGLQVTEKFFEIDPTAQRNVEKNDLRRILGAESERGRRRTPSFSYPFWDLKMMYGEVV